MLVLGFALLLALLIGTALVVLSLVFLAAAVVVQMFGALGGGAPWIPALATGVQLAAGAAFVLGLILVFIGAAALFFPQVRAFLDGLRILFRIAQRMSLMAGLANALHLASGALRGSGGLLSGPSTPPSAAEVLETFERNLHDAGNAVPDVPTVSHESFFLETENIPPRRVRGFVWKPDVADLPDIEIVTNRTTGSANVQSLKDALHGAGNKAGELKEKVRETGNGLQETANLLDEIAGLIEQASS